MPQKCFCLWLIYIFNNIYFAQAQDIVFEPPKSDECRTTTGLIGSCTDMRKCPYFPKGSQMKEQPYICYFDRSIPFVCCPSSKDQLIENKNENLSTEAPLVNFQCGRRESEKPHLISVRAAAFVAFPTVVKGIPSAKNSWPWMALLGRKASSGNFFFCDGVLINEKFVLTAAHCLLEKGSLFVRLGEHDHSVNVPQGIDAPKDFEVTNITFHPQYDLHFGYNDLALIELPIQINFSKSVKPICLPWGNLTLIDLVNQSVTVTGWGAERYGGNPSAVLREAEITIFDPSICLSSYSTLVDFKKLWPKGMTSENIVCAGDLQEGRDSCQGDSGGPLVHRQSDGTYSLAGIVSRGHGCGKPDFPGIYTPIRNIENLQWIKDIAF